MTGRRQVPEPANPRPRAFRARSGDTMPDLIIPGLYPADPDSQARRISTPGQSRYNGYTSRPAPPRRRWRRALIRRTAALLGILVFLVAAGFGVILLVSPSAGQAQSIVRAQARAHDIPYPGSPVPARFADALIATEDHRFYSDPGIDPIAVGRVALGYLMGHGTQQGGATLTQRRAKMLYTPGSSTTPSEVKQIALAIKLDMTYSKAQILRMYTEVAYFGQNYYGLGEASCGYFGVPPARLTWTQAALLAGLVQAPSAYDPLTHPALARERLAHVLGRLAATGTLTAAQAKAALAQPFGLVPRQLARAAPAPGTPTCGRTRT